MVTPSQDAQYIRNRSLCILCGKTATQDAFLENLRILRAEIQNQKLLHPNRPTEVLFVTVEKLLVRKPQYLEVTYARDWLPNSGPYPLCADDKTIIYQLFGQTVKLRNQVFEEFENPQHVKAIKRNRVKKEEIIKAKEREIIRLKEEAIMKANQQEILRATYAARYIKRDLVSIMAEHSETPEEFVQLGDPMQMHVPHHEIRVIMGVDPTPMPLPPHQTYEVGPLGQAGLLLCVCVGCLVTRRVPTVNMLSFLDIKPA